MGNARWQDAGVGVRAWLTNSRHSYHSAASEAPACYKKSEDSTAGSCAMMPNTTMQPTNGADRFRPIGSSGAPFAADREAVSQTEGTEGSWAIKFIAWRLSSIPTSEKTSYFSPRRSTSGSSILRRIELPPFPYGKNKAASIRSNTALHSSMHPVMPNQMKLLPQ